MSASGEMVAARGRASVGCGLQKRQELFAASHEPPVDEVARDGRNAHCRHRGCIAVDAGGRLLIVERPGYGSAFKPDRLTYLQERIAILDLAMFEKIGRHDRACRLRGLAEALGKVDQDVSRKTRRRGLQAREIEVDSFSPSDRFELTHHRFGPRPVLCPVVGLE